jgi:aldose sugar dehydrogenase
LAKAIKRDKNILILCNMLSIYIMAKSVQFQLLLSFELVTIILIGIIILRPFNAALAQPTVIKDPNLKVELFVQGLRSPTSMAFLGPNDILVLEKDDGTIQKIINGTISQQPLLQVPVATKNERGMLGIAIAKHKNGPTYVFLYFTESGGGKIGDDVTNGVQPAANVLYRYELLNGQLVNPKLLLSLPAAPSSNHNGGKVLVGPDNNVYVVIGDLKSHRTQAQNVVDGPQVDGTGGILVVGQDSQPVTNPPLELPGLTVGNGSSNSTSNEAAENSIMIKYYYAYGIRNSFGMDFDPVTKKLWDTENGPNYGDEINLVEPGFNSGWAQVQGFWTPEGKIGNENAASINLNPSSSSNLMDFGGRGKYRAPEFIWFQPVAPTALKFFDSAKLGKQYQNDMFVGDIRNGNLYDFTLNQSRTGLVLNDTLANKIANTLQDSQPVLFASGFDDGITDLQVGPNDGYLYVLTLAGSIYRIVPSS